MKLNPDCVRHILLEFETFPIGGYEINAFKKSIEQYGEENVLYTLVKLIEAGYINATFIRTQDGRPHIDVVYDITFAGHQFLSDICSDTVWSKTKSIISKMGVTSIPAITQVASGIITCIIKSELGLT